MKQWPQMGNDFNILNRALKQLIPYLCQNFGLLLFRLFHIILAVVVFFSSTGVVLSKHYCQNELKSVAIFHKAKACHKQHAMKSCPFHPGMMIPASEADKNCCDDETSYFQDEAEWFAQPGSFHLVKILSPAQLIDYSCPAPVVWEKSSTHYLNYKPPLIAFDRPIRFQQFLC